MVIEKKLRGRRETPTSKKSEKLKGTWVLAAIDGTLSDDYFTGTKSNVCRDRSEAKHKSYTFRFFQDFRGKHKEYWQGPSVDGAGLFGGGDCNGEGVETISRGVYSWLKRQVEEVDSPLIVLIGHSRGAWVALDIAKRLKKDHIPVYFMGLYDAVDMTYFAGHSTVSNNVKFVYHAVRHPETGSRRSKDLGRLTNWKNTGRQHVEPTVYLEKLFSATHGALGGAPPSSCVTRKNIDGLSNDSCITPLSARMNHSSAMAADAFIRKGARQRGVPLSLQGDMDIQDVQKVLEEIEVMKTQFQVY